MQSPLLKRITTRHCERLIPAFAFCILEGLISLDLEALGWDSEVNGFSLNNVTELQPTFDLNTPHPAKEGPFLKTLA